MPSTLPLPELSDLVKAFPKAVRAEHENHVDDTQGSLYEVIGGGSAIIWQQQTQRDRDLFRAIYFDTAEDSDLTNLIEQRYGVTRTLDTYGIGYANLQRATAAAGAGTIWAGTRLSIPGSLGDLRYYQVSSDTAVSASSLAVNVPIQACDVGTGTAADVSGGIQVQDPLWDNTWSGTRLVCAEGTDFEDATTYRARTREALRNSRVGFVKSLTDACTNIGAVNSVFLASNYSGVDYGLNAAYVADVGYSGSTTLLRAVAVKLESYRVMGADLAICPLNYSRVTVSATINLWDAPSRFDTVSIEQAIIDYLVSYFNDSRHYYTYRVDGLAAACMKASRAVQSVTFTNPSSDALILTGNTLPSSLNRYTLAAQDITLSFSGPV